MNVEVYSDGSATTKDKPGGYGWVIVLNGQKFKEGFGFLENATNNDAELEGAIAVLQKLHSLLESQDLREIYKGKCDITFVCDSELILKWATGEYKSYQEDKKEKIKYLQMLMSIMCVKTSWVKGHSGNEFNERCDELANKARIDRISGSVWSKKPEDFDYSKYDSLTEKIEKKTKISKKSNNTYLSLLNSLLRKVNAVTAYHRHGNPIPSQILDDLSNRQIEIEESIDKLQKE